MKKITLVSLLALFACFTHAQTSPDYIFGAASANWTTGLQGTTVTTGVFQWQFQAAADGAIYFKLGETASSTDGSGFWVNSAAGDMSYTGAGAMWAAYYNANMGGGGAITFNAVNTHYYVINARKQGGANADFAVFESASPIATISSVSQSFTSPNLTVTVTANTTPDAVQKFWVRYTKDNWATSAFTEATGSGTTYSANIDATGATKLEYYIFTTVQAPAGFTDYDFYTVSLNNNGGKNYTYQVSPLAGDYYIPQGANPQGFASLYDAAQALTEAGLGANTRFLIAADLTEPKSIGLANNSSHTLTITPATSTAKAITFTQLVTTQAIGGAIVIGMKNGLTLADLMPSQNIIIDGSYNGNNTKLLTIRNGNGTPNIPYSPTITIPANYVNAPITILDGSHDITVKYSKLLNWGNKNNSNGTEWNTCTVVNIRAIPDKANIFPYNITFDNNNIEHYIGNTAVLMNFSSYTTTSTEVIPGTKGTNIKITNNWIRGRRGGINLNFVSDIEVSGNEIHMVNSYNATAQNAIYSGSSFGGANSGGNILITGNKIVELKSSIASTSAAYSISGISSGNSGNWLISNNYITGFGGPSAKCNISGISAGVGNTNIYHNTILLNSLGGSVVYDEDVSENNYTYSAISLSTWVTGFDLKNNIIVSNESTKYNQAIKTANNSTRTSVYTSDNNLFYLRGAGTLATYSRQYGVFSDYQAATIGGTTHDGNSKATQDILFVKEATDGTANLHLNTSQEGNPYFAVPLLTSVTKDIDWQTRPFTGNTWAYAGADELQAMFLGTSINNLDNTDTKIMRTATGVMVTFEGERTVELFSINGSLIERISAVKEYSRNLNKGIYVLKVDGKSTKVVL